MSSTLKASRISQVLDVMHQFKQNADGQLLHIKMEYQWITQSPLYVLCLCSSGRKQSLQDSHTRPCVAPQQSITNLSAIIRSLKIYRMEIKVFFLNEQQQKKQNIAESFSSPTHRDRVSCSPG